MSSPPPSQPVPEAEGAVNSIQGANPFVGMTLGQVARAGGRWATALGRRPTTLTAAVLQWAAQEAQVVVGSTDVTPTPHDRRFADPAWRGPIWRRVAQSYMVTRDSVLGSVDQIDLDQKSADRARFALMQLTEAFAPTNNLWTNPVALRTAVDTRGRSLLDGARHFVHDVRHNGGMPSQVDTRPFQVGTTVATTAGTVIHRTPLFELIRYQPTTPKVRSVPTVIIPPQINRFYFLDLAPGRSFVEYALSQGIQVLCISWRNPGPRHRDWDMDDYAASCIEAMRVAAEVTRSPQVNVAGFCAGGMTTSSVLSHLALTDDPLVKCATLGVTMIDSEVNSTLNMFASEKTVSTAIDRSRKDGVLRGSSLAKMFAFVRPNDLIWNYFVSNYLLGRNPPAFDVLAWNKDATNMSAALHAEFMNMWLDNALMHAGSARVLGTPVDLAAVENDVYVVGALTDHLVPWQSAYAATQVLGGETRYVLSNSGHIQALINPPGNPKATYFRNDVNSPDPTTWLQGATRHTGSWWEDWATWTVERSGELRARPRALGSRKYPAGTRAPGTYVTE